MYTLMIPSLHPFPLGAIPAKTQVYQVAQRTHKVQVEAVKKFVCGKKFWIGTDEWTSDRGLAIANIIVGCHGRTFVVDSVNVPCRGIIFIFFAP